MLLSSKSNTNFNESYFGDFRRKETLVTTNPNSTHGPKFLDMNIKMILED